MEDYPFGVEELNQELAGDLEPGEELENEDMEEIRAEGLPNKPSFPIITFALAVTKDFLDIASFGLLGTLTNIIVWVAIRIYLFNRVGFMKRWLYRKYIFTFILEFIPFVNIFPQWTFFVLRAYAKENERVDAILTAIEKLLLRYGGAPESLERFV